jgi:cytidylate kinase
MKYYFLVLLLVSSFCVGNPSDNPLLQKGWNALVVDNENDAFRYFYHAYEKATAENNIRDKAEALLYLGICSHGASSEKGLRYATQSLSEFKKLEVTNIEEAKTGRSRCLQLISTIYSRQKKYVDASRLSHEVVATLKNKKDKTGTLGLAYNSLGTIHEFLKHKDSAIYFFKMAIQEFERTQNTAYLPTAYIKMGDLSLLQNLKGLNNNYYNKALTIAENSQNKQAQVWSLIALGKWYLNTNLLEAEKLFGKASMLSSQLSDKLFEIKVTESLIDLKKKQQNFKEASQLQDKILIIKEDYYSLEREQIAKNLEVQFEVAEKDRKLELISKEKEVSKLTNFLLIGLISLLILVFTLIYFFMKRISKRDKELLKTNQNLLQIQEEQKKIKEQQLNYDIEHKENQLSAITIQILQKNELFDEIKKIIQSKEVHSNEQLSKLVNQHFASDNNWSDFDKYFESINKNFYTKLKTSFPDIGSNDLKICALIKLNLSIKEMASILNISPDSVKTARYRLRKKLHLNTEDNLTEFIISI